MHTTVEKAVMARIVVDPVKCVNLGVCESLAPEYFELDDTGALVLPLGAEVDANDIDAVREAALGCPTAAIRLLTE